MPTHASSSDRTPPDGPVAIVTGAGSGIGRATAVGLARHGWRVVLAGRRAGPLDETGGMLETEWRATTADVTDSAQVDRLIGGAMERFGRIDALINNAGSATARLIGRNDPAFLDEMFRVNAISAYLTVDRVWPVFVEQARRGVSPCRVVSVSSVSTLDPFPGLSAYAGAKAALNTLARSIRAEGAEHGILGFTVAPGSVETAMLRGLVGEEQLPTEMTLDPSDVAGVIVACAVGERDDENGETIIVPSP